MGIDICARVEACIPEQQGLYLSLVGYLYESPEANCMATGDWRKTEELRF
jgi:hypothetical protein